MSLLEGVLGRVLEVAEERRREETERLEKFIEKFAG